MKTAKEVYPEWEEGYGPCDYSPIVEDFGTIVIRKDDDDYQGDSRILYDNNGTIGYLRFGWGSCSGCDALQACDTFKDIQDLMDELRGQVMWFDSKTDALKFFETHDWQGDYDWREENREQFVSSAIEYLNN